jgi:hypothetical protein
MPFVERLDIFLLPRTMLLQRSVKSSDFGFRQSDLAIVAISKYHHSEQVLFV